MKNTLSTFCVIFMFFFTLNSVPCHGQGCVPADIENGVDIKLSGNCTHSIFLRRPADPDLFILASVIQDLSIDPGSQCEMVISVDPTFGCPIGHVGKVFNCFVDNSDDVPCPKVDVTFDKDASTVTVAFDASAIDASKPTGLAGSFNLTLGIAAGSANSFLQIFTNVFVGDTSGFRNPITPEPGTPTPTPTPGLTEIATIQAWPVKDSNIVSDTAIIPASPDLPALIEAWIVERGTFNGVAGEEVKFELTDESKGELQSDSVTGRIVTAETDTTGFARVSYFAKPIADFTNDTVELPVTAKIKVTHTKSGSDGFANVNVGLGLAVLDVRALDTQINTNLLNSPFAVLIKTESLFFPDLKLEEYALQAKDKVWKDKTIGMQLVTQWINQLTDGSEADDRYIGPCEFVSKQGGESNFLQALLSSPTFLANGTFWPGITMQSTGTHYYKLKVRGIVLNSSNNRVGWLEATKNDTAVIGLTTFDYPSTFELVSCSLNPTSVNQFIMLEAVKKVPIWGKWADGFLTVSGLLCDLSKGDFQGFALNLWKALGSKYLDRLEEVGSVDTLNFQEQMRLIKALDTKKFFGDIANLAKLIELSQSGSEVKTDIEKRSDRLKMFADTDIPFEPEILDIYNNSDAGALFDDGFFRNFEVDDLLSAIFWNIEGLEVSRPDGSEAPLITPEEFDINTLLPEYIFFNNSGVAVAVIPTSGNYIFNVTPGSGGFQMNVTGGEFEGSFGKIVRETQDASLIWNSEDNIVDADTDGDGLPDITLSPVVTDLEEIVVGPEGVESEDGSSAAVPEANFIADQPLGPAPRTVNFTDISKGSPTDWFWLFGDGNTSLVQNPTHTYGVEGEFSVTLTVSNQFGEDSLTKEDFINVTPSTSVKSFTFKCDNEFLMGPNGRERFIMESGKDESCLLSLTNATPNKFVEVSTNLRKGLKPSIEIEPKNGFTDANGELRFTIKSNETGTDWVSWAVADDNGEFRFSKDAYEKGTAWGMFVEVQ